MLRARIRRASRYDALWLVGGLLCAAGASAESPHEVVQRLTPYDTQGDVTFDALKSLDERAGQAGSRADRAELSFLHAMASTDLWLIAEVRDDAALRQRVADHLGVEIAAVPGVLADALLALQGTMPRESLEDALSAVQLLDAGHEGALPAVKGTRGSLAYVALAARGGGLAEPSIEGLAALSADPCPDMTACEAPFLHFDPQGRAALATLQRLHAAQRNLASVQQADPLIVAVHDEMQALLVKLDGMHFRPGPTLTEGPECPSVEVCGEAEAPSVIVFVESGRVRMAFVPTLRFDAERGVQLEAAGEPLWPQSREVSIPDEMPPYLRAISEVTAALRELRGDHEDLRLAVGADTKTRAHVYARVLLSARSAGFEEPMALGHTADGSARVQQVRVVPAPAADRLEPGELNVFMLMKGYSVRRWGPSVNIDRKPGLDGDLEFDIPALVSKARTGQAARSSYLRFVPYVPARDLVSTTFAVAPEDKQVTLILP